MSEESTPVPGDYVPFSWPGVDIRAIRRVVTGDRPDGSSTVLFDGIAPRFGHSPDFESVSTTYVWRETSDIDASASFDGAAVHDRVPDGGTQFFLVQIEPGHFLSAHTTPTIDYHCVVSGEVTCILDDGEVTVRAGELLVQRGTRHAWQNRGSVPFVSVAVMVSRRSA